MDYFTKSYHPPGTPPGTLVKAARGAKATLSLHLIDYTDTEFKETELSSASECRPYLQRPSNTWIHVQGDADPAFLKRFGELFNLHPLAMEDVLNTGQRSKLESYDGQLFVVLNLMDIEGSRVTIRQLSLFVGDRYIVSFCNGDRDPFEPIRSRLRKGGKRLQGRPIDYLFYALLDLVIDQGFPVLESFGEELEALEEELLNHPGRETLAWIHQIKRELLLLRRLLWPQREVINGLLREDHSLISEETKTYLRDCYDHSIQILDLLETYREMISGMLDVYLSSVNNHTNEIMRILTIIATLFIPLTFIVGVYGMNFEHASSPWAMPELRWYYGYPLVWLLMVMVAALLLVFFKRRKWF